MKKEHEEITCCSFWLYEHPAGKILFSDQISGLIGIDADKLKDHKHYLSLIHPEDMQKVKDSLYACIDGSSNKYESRYRIKNPKGEYIWFFDRGAIIENEDDKIIISGQVNEHNNADEALIRSEKRHKAIVRALPDMIFRFNAKYEFIDVNCNDDTILYEDPELFIGKKISEVLPPFLAEMTINNIDAALQTGQLQVYRYSLEIEGKECFFESRMTVSGENEVLAVVRNITDDTLRQRILLENERLFRSLFSTMPDIVIRADMEGNLLFVNDNGIKLSGYSKEELMKMDVFSFLAPEDRDRAMKNTIQMINAPLGPQIYNLITKEGERIPFEVNGDVLKDENGIPYGMVHVCRDLRERLKAEEESRKQKQLFEQVLSASSVGLALAVDRKIIWANNAMQELFGYKKEEYVGKDTSMIYANKDDYNLIQNLINESIKAKKPIRLDLRFKRKDGSLFWGHYKINPVDPSNPLAGTIVSIIDISDRKKAEERLEDSQHILADIFNSVSEGIIYTDLAGNVIEVNKAVEKITGINKDELLNKNSVILATKFLSVKNVGKVISIVNNVIKGNDITPFVLEYEDKILEINSKYNKVSKRITGTLRDITEQKKFEQELVVAKEKAEESDKLKTAFLQNLSHEIRTPLNGIIGFTKLVTDPEIDTETVDESLRMIKISSDRLIALIENVIMLSELETGQLKTSYEYFSPNDIIAEMVKIFKAIAEAKGLKFQTQISSEDHDLSIFSDKIAVKRIISQLVDNAIKFTNKGSISIGYDIYKDKEFCIFVNDTGSGIEKKNIGKIFNKFEKLSSPSNWMSPGTGIGLTIAKGLTEHLGGRIEVDSKWNKGSSFILYLRIEK
jgi:PAS domain S-box-containing protein